MGKLARQVVHLWKKSFRQENNFPTIQFLGCTGCTPSPCHGAMLLWSLQDAPGSDNTVATTTNNVGGKREKNYPLSTQNFWIYWNKSWIERLTIVPFFSWKSV